MVPSTQTEAERQAAAKSLQAQTAVRELKRQIDSAINAFAERMDVLADGLMAAQRAVGSDSTRPHYTDDLGRLNVQLRRYSILRDAIYSKDL